MGVLGTMSGLPPSLFALIILVVFLVLKRLLTSSLRKIPGPLWSRFTPLVLRWQELRGNRTRFIHGLHEKYGPAVRIAPDEVSFASLDAVKEIYCSGGSGYGKSEFYDMFKVYGRRTMFTTLPKEDHAKRRRILADRYANSNIMRQPSLSGIETRSRNFVKLCHVSMSEKAPVDLYIILHSYAFDVVTHHLFHPHGADSLQSAKDEEIMRQVAFDDSLQNRLIKFYYPVLHKLIGNILYMFAKPRETPLADDFVLNASSAQDAAAFSLLSRMQEKSDELEHMDMAAESLDHMAAGIETTGDALCFLLWELSQPRSRQFQQRLQVELKENPGAAFDKLPFLDAVIMEGLRRFPAIPMSLPRRVPPGGKTIDGFAIPEKTIVSCQAYSLHRLEDVFPNPERFDPDRWLEKSGDAERKRLFFAFSTGGRGCIGKHLALAEMKILLRDIYSHYSTRPDPSMRLEEMEASDQLISSRPAGHRCLLRFEALEA